MFYSSQKEKIVVKSNSVDNCERKDTIMNLSQVFTGTYWDEFSLAPFFTLKKKSQALMLGLGLGGGIRPLMIEEKFSTIDSVEIDNKTIIECQSIFDNNFPKINLNFYNDDAFQFIKSSTKTYDTIFVDIYTSIGTPNNVFDKEFIDSLSKRLSSNGIVLWNNFGIANHLRNFCDFDPALKVASSLKDNFRYIKLIPHRRNVTLIASNRPISVEGPTLSKELHEHDHLFAMISYIKSKYGENVDDLSFSPFSNEVTFDFIYNEQKKSWTKFVRHVNKVSKSFNGPLFLDHVPMARFIANDPNSIEFVSMLMIKDRLTSVFIPTFLGAYGIQNNLDLSWLFDLTFDQKEKIKNNHPTVFETYYLPCLASLLMSNIPKYEKYLEKLKNIVEGYHVPNN